MGPKVSACAGAAIAKLVASAAATVNNHTVNRDLRIITPRLGEPEPERSELLPPRRSMAFHQGERHRYPAERRVSTVISLGANTRNGGPQKPAPPQV
jgi:hypothetical protein